MAISVALCAAACTPGETACAAVSADIPATAQAGQTVEIAMAELFSTCNDEGQGSNVASGDVTLELVSAEASAQVVATGTADVSDDGTALVSVAIPDDASGTLTVMYGDAPLGTVAIED